MQRHHGLAALALAGCASVVGCGGGGEKTAVPPPEVQTQAAQPANQPTTVNGCLKAGDAPDTFVVTAARTGGSSDTATYQLIGGQGVKLADHIGRSVQVSGVVRETQELESRARADASQPAATSGGAGSGGEANAGGSKPVVETRTEVQIKRLEVSEIKPTGDRCE